MTDAVAVPPVLNEDTSIPAPERTQVFVGEGPLGDLRRMFNPAPYGWGILYCPQWGWVAVHGRDSSIVIEPNAVALWGRLIAITGVPADFRAAAGSPLEEAAMRTASSRSTDPSWQKAAAA